MLTTFTLLDRLEITGTLNKDRNTNLQVPTGFGKITPAVYTA